MEAPRVAPSLRDPRVALVGRPGSRNPPACPNPYVTTPGPTRMAPIRCQVCPLVLSLLLCSLWGAARRASALSTPQRTKLIPPSHVLPLGLCPPHPLLNHGQEPCLPWPPPWPLPPLARTLSPLPLPVQAKTKSLDLDSGAQCRALQPAGLAHSPFRERQERLRCDKAQIRAKPTDIPRTARRPTA